MIDTSLAASKVASTLPAGTAPTRPTMDFASMKFQFAEHVLGTGYKGPYAVEASFGKTQKTTFHVELNGDVKAFHSFYEPDPELGGVASSEPSRFARSTLNAAEKQQLVKALAPFKANSEVAIVLERLTAKSIDAALAAATRILTGGATGEPVSNAGGVRGLGYSVE